MYPILTGYLGNGLLTLLPCPDFLSHVKRILEVKFNLQNPAIDLINISNLTIISHEGHSADFEDCIFAMSLT